MGATFLNQHFYKKTKRFQCLQFFFMYTHSLLYWGVDGRVDKKKCKKRVECIQKPRLAISREDTTNIICSSAPTIYICKSHLYTTDAEEIMLEMSHQNIWENDKNLQQQNKENFHDSL